MKETSSDQTTTIQERMRRHQRKQRTWCIAFGESVLWSLIQNNFSKCKHNKASEFHNVPVLFCVCIIENVTVLTRQMIEKLSFDTFLIDWWCIRQKKKKRSGQKSENTDTGCLEYWQKYFGAGRSGDVALQVWSTDRSIMGQAGPVMLRCRFGVLTEVFWGRQVRWRCLAGLEYWQKYFEAGRSGDAALQVWSTDRSILGQAGLVTLPCRFGVLTEVFWGWQVWWRCLAGLEYWQKYFGAGRSGDAALQVWSTDRSILGQAGLVTLPCRFGVLTEVFWGWQVWWRCLAGLEYWQKYFGAGRSGDAALQVWSTDRSILGLAGLVTLPCRFGVLTEVFWGRQVWWRCLAGLEYWQKYFGAGRSGDAALQVWSTDRSILGQAVLVTLPCRFGVLTEVFWGRQVWWRCLAGLEYWQKYFGAGRSGDAALQVWSTDRSILGQAGLVTLPCRFGVLTEVFWGRQVWWRCLAGLEYWQKYFGAGRSGDAALQVWSTDRSILGQAGLVTLPCRFGVLTEVFWGRQVWWRCLAGLEYWQKYFGAGRSGDAALQVWSTDRSILGQAGLVTLPCRFGVLTEVFWGRSGELPCRFGVLTEVFWGRQVWWRCLAGLEYWQKYFGAGRSGHAALQVWSTDRSILGLAGLVMLPCRFGVLTEVIWGWQVWWRCLAGLEYWQKYFGAGRSGDAVLQVWSTDRSILRQAGQVMLPCRFGVLTEVFWGRQVWWRCLAGLEYWQKYFGAGRSGDAALQVWSTDRSILGLAGLVMLPCRFGVLTEVFWGWQVWSCCLAGLEYWQKYFGAGRSGDAVLQVWSTDRSIYRQAVLVMLPCRFNPPLSLW